MWPVRHAGDVSMLPRIDVDVIDAPAQAGFVTNETFPIAALPDAAFVFSAAPARQPLPGGNRT